MTDMNNRKSHPWSSLVEHSELTGSKVSDVKGGLQLNAEDFLVQKIARFLEGHPTISNRQAQLMDGLLECRLQASQDPMTEEELLGIYKMITEEVLPISLPM